MNKNGKLNRRLSLDDERDAAGLLLNDASNHVHLMGVCGVGMAGLAFHLAARGLRVSGCDLSCGRMASWLVENGVCVKHGHDSAHLKNVDWLVRSTAVRSDNPEIAAASASGIPVFRRGAVLAALSADFYSIIVGGTHGKTSAAAMIVQALRSCGMPPSFCVGGESDMLGGVGGLGKAGIMVAEADESDGTLACYRPDIAVILNIEFDHAEFFKDVESVARDFETFARAAVERVIYCADNTEARRLCAGMDKAFGYGFGSSSDLRAHDYSADEKGSGFGVSLHGRKLGELAMRTAGRHNVLNALAACATAISRKGRFPDIRNGLAEFRPVRRRFERIVENEDVIVISDYAHHPSEVAALMESAKTLRRARLIAVFQPHRFSRTRALAADFPKAFEGLDELILTPVYAASEDPVPGGTSWDLYAHFRDKSGLKVSCARGLDQAWAYLLGELKKGDGLLIIGAGDVARIGEWAGTKLRSPGVMRDDAVESMVSELKASGLEATKLAAREPMACKTTLHVGGRADIFAEVGSEPDLARILAWAGERGMPVRVVGGGSNILAGDLGFRGLVLRLDRERFGWIREDADGRVIACGAAVSLNNLVGRLAERGKAGLLFLSGIPGTVGGALRMNAGAWGSSIGERTAWVRAVNSDGKEELISGDALCFGYRQCVSLTGRVILEAGFNVDDGDAGDIRNTLEDIARKRAWMKGLRSAGSVFRNPPGDFAGRLIEQAGLKGFRIGGARVSEMHGNLIVTESGATASDVNALMELIVCRVKSISGIALEKEIVCLE